MKESEPITASVPPLLRKSMLMGGADCTSGAGTSGEAVKS
jgi:hypothetical protein